MESDYSTYFNIHTSPLSSAGQTDPHYSLNSVRTTERATVIHLYNLQKNEIMLI